jgi:Cu/Ag efflux pump CusA
MAGLLAVLGIAICQAFVVAAAIRRAQLADGGRLTPDLVADAVADAGASVLAAATVTAVVLLPFMVMGDVAGTELLHTAAAVILAGLIAATLLNTLVLPAACLRFGPGRAPEQDPDLTGPLSVPRPREEPEVAAAPRRAGRPDSLTS